MATRSKLECTFCQTEDVLVECISCDGHFCKKCDERYHNHPSHPNRQKHIRKAMVSLSFAQCNCCGSENVDYICITCDEQQLFCTLCDCKFHSHQERQGHVRKQFRRPSSLTVDDGIHCCNCHIICTVECKDCSKSFCSECDEKYHDYPNLEEHTRKELKRVCSICEGSSITVRCDECCGWYCNRCDGVRHENKLANHTRKGIKERTPKEEIICGLKEQIKELTKSVEEYKTDLEQLKVKKDYIVHQKEVQIQDLENNFKSSQERHEMEKESLEKENRDLQNQNKTLKIQVTDKEAELQRYLPHKEGTWKKYSGGDVPEDGVIAHDEGNKLYVCRTEVDGDVVPGWIQPYFNKVCNVYHNGKQHSKSPFEVLVPNSSFEWIGCHGDKIPPLAVPGGKTKDGEVLYVGRIKHTDGYYYVGKVQPSLNGCYNYPPLLPSVNGDFTLHPIYQILVWK